MRKLGEDKNLNTKLQYVQHGPHWMVSQDSNFWKVRSFPPSLATELISYPSDWILQ